MLSSTIPTKFPIPFANSANPGFISPIPVPAQASGRASLTTGFSELNFDPLAAGGIPPWGKDFNGLLNQITDWLRLVAAGGAPVGYDAIFQAAISGYPRYALVKTAGGDRFWLSTVENNVTNPDTGGAGWALFPDVIVQQQFGNYAGTETGTPNNYVVTLYPAPASLAAIVGSPIRVKVGSSGPNTINNPVIRINGFDPLVMVNSSGQPLSIGQISRINQIFEGFNDGAGFFQVTSPGPLFPGSQPSPSAITGVIYEWGAETPPSWGLECNGGVYPISSYPNLFNIIKWRFGGDLANTFAVPDKRGAFTRGWDHGRGLDPGASQRTQFASGGAVVGDHIGSWQKAGLNGADLLGSKMILTGYPELGLGGPVVGNGYYDQFTDVHNVFPIGTRVGTDFTPVAPGAPAQITYQWNLLVGNGAFDTQGGIGPQPGGVMSRLSEVFELGCMIAKLSSPAGETRPVNIDMMYVIAF